MTNSEYQQLVEFLGRRFAGIDQSFDAIDRRFDTMERHFDARFDAIDTQLRGILGHFDQLYTRFDRLDQGSQAIAQVLWRIESRFGSSYS